MSGRNGKSLKLISTEASSRQTRIAVTVPQLLTVVEVAAMLRLSTKTIYKMVSRRRIPFRKAGRQLLFDMRDVEAWTKAGADNQ